MMTTAGLKLDATIAFPFAAAYSDPGSTDVAGC
jgi:hypothetical protein